MTLTSLETHLCVLSDPPEFSLLFKNVTIFFGRFSFDENVVSTLLLRVIFIQRSSEETQMWLKASVTIITQLYNCYSFTATFHIPGLISERSLWTGDASEFTYGEGKSILISGSQHRMENPSIYHPFTAFSCSRQYVNYILVVCFLTRCSNLFNIRSFSNIISCRRFALPRIFLSFQLWQLEGAT